MLRQHGAGTQPGAGDRLETDSSATLVGTTGTFTTLEPVDVRAGSCPPSGTVKGAVWIISTPGPGAVTFRHASGVASPGDCLHGRDSGATAELASVGSGSATLVQDFAFFQTGYRTLQHEWRSVSQEARWVFMTDPVTAATPGVGATLRILTHAANGQPVVQVLGSSQPSPGVGFYVGSQQSRVSARFHGDLQIRDVVPGTGRRLDLSFHGSNANRQQSFADANGTLVTNSGANGHGVASWGDPGPGSFDTGDAVCQQRGFACVATVEVGDVERESCSTVQSGLFLALCK